MRANEIDKKNTKDESNLSCMLIPRFGNQEIIDDLKQTIENNFRTIFDDYAWKLNRLLIRSDSVEWNMELPSKTSPGYVMRIIRTSLSNIIWDKIPALRNPSNDFWAPGYLIMSGQKPISDKLREEYIAQSRRRQKR
jgi:REP element-mobilizing transposase RayT